MADIEVLNNRQSGLRPGGKELIQEKAAASLQQIKKGEESRLDEVVWGGGLINKVNIGEKAD